MTTQPDIFTDFEAITAAAEAAAHTGVELEDLGDHGTWITVPCPYKARASWVTIKLTGTTREVTNHAQGGASFEASNEDVVAFIAHAGQTIAAEASKGLAA